MLPLTVWSSLLPIDTIKVDSLKPITYPKYRIERLVHLAQVGMAATNALNQYINEVNLAMRAQVKAEEGLAIKENERVAEMQAKEEWHKRYDNQILITKDEKKTRNKWRGAAIGSVVVLVLSVILGR